MCSFKLIICNPFPTGSGQHSDGLGLQLQMEDDDEQPPCSVTDKADSSTVIEISDHTVDTVLYLPVCRDWQKNMCSVVGLQFGKGNHDHNEKPLDNGLDQAPSIRGRIKRDGNCYFRAVAQEITESQEIMQHLGYLSHHT